MIVSCKQLQQNMHTFEDIDIHCQYGDATSTNLYALLRKSLTVVFMKRFKLDNYLEKWHELSNGGQTVSCVRKNDASDEYMFIFCESDFSRVHHVTYEFVVDKMSDNAWLAVGAGIERINLQTRPRWEYRDIQMSAAYAVASNQYISAHGDASLNNCHKGYNFNTGSVVQVTYNGTKKTLEFKVKDQDRVITMNNVLPEARPCVITWGGTLSVSIK